MNPDRDLAITRPARGQDLATVPDRPAIAPDELYTGGPFVLEMLTAEPGWKHTLGWMERSERKGGPCFVLVRSTFLGSLRAVERFPLTDAGWARAWKALVRLSRDDATRTRDVLAARARAAASEAAAAELAGQSIGLLAGVRYVPGSGELPDIDSGVGCDVRFLADRVVILPAASARVLATFPYPEVEAVEIGGPGHVQRWTPGQQAALGLVFGLPGILAGQATDIKTVVRFQTDQCELFVVHSKTEPDVLRMELSVPCGRSARPGKQPAGQARSWRAPPGLPATRRPWLTSSPSWPACSNPAC